MLHATTWGCFASEVNSSQHVSVSPFKSGRLHTIVAAGIQQTKKKQPNERGRRGSGRSLTVCSKFLPSLQNLCYTNCRLLAEERASGSNLPLKWRIKLRTGNEAVHIQTDTHLDSPTCLKRQGSVWQWSAGFILLPHHQMSLIFTHFTFKTEYNSGPSVIGFGHRISSYCRFALMMALHMYQMLRS